MYTILPRIVEYPGRTVALGHYAGRGFVGFDTKLWISASVAKAQSIQLEQAFSNL